MKKNKKNFKIPYTIIIFIIAFLLAILSIIGNVAKDRRLIKINISSKKIQNNDNKDDSILDINSERIKGLYKKVQDNRHGELMSWVYPENDNIIISDLDIDSKVKIVFASLDEKEFSASDCSNIYSISQRLYQKIFRCDTGEYNYIDFDKIKLKYQELFGTLDEISDNPVVMNNEISRLFVPKLNKVTNKLGYYSYISSDLKEGPYVYKRKLTSAVKNEDESISITENIIITDSTGNLAKEENIIYTFKKLENNHYVYYSRIKKH